MSSIPLVGISLLLGGAPATSEERVVAHNLCHANAEFEFIRVLVRLRALLFQSVDHGTQRCGNVPLKCLCRFRDFLNFGIGVEARNFMGAVCSKMSIR